MLPLTHIKIHLEHHSVRINSMESEDDYLENNPERPAIFGLEAFDLDFQYAMYGPSFGLNIPSYEVGPLRLVPQLEMGPIFSQIQRAGTYVVFAMHSIWHITLYWLLSRLAQIYCGMILLDWWNYVPEGNAVPIHLFLLLCSNSISWKELSQSTLRYFDSAR